MMNNICISKEKDRLLKYKMDNVKIVLWGILGIVILGFCVPIITQTYKSYIIKHETMKEHNCIDLNQIGDITRKEFLNTKCICVNEHFFDINSKKYYLLFTLPLNTRPIYDIQYREKQKYRQDIANFRLSNVDFTHEIKYEDREYMCHKINHVQRNI